MKLRIKFAKYGCMKFIGHLDVMRFFQKAIRRAEIDIAYSEGYSPHQIMSFASPLGVGVESHGEYMDIVVNSNTSSKTLLDALNSVMVEGIDVLSVRRLPDDAKNAMASVQWADYTIAFREGYEPDFKTLEEAIKEMVNRKEIIVTKETKKSTRELDLKPCIREIRFQPNHTIFMSLKAGSEDNIKPELVIKAICEIGGFSLEKIALLMTREDLYGENMVSLNDYGEDF